VRACRSRSLRFTGRAFCHLGLLFHGLGTVLLGRDDRDLVVELAIWQVSLTPQIIGPDNAGVLYTQTEITI